MKKCFEILLIYFSTYDACYQSQNYFKFNQLQKKKIIRSGVTVLQYV